MGPLNVVTKLRERKLRRIRDGGAVGGLLGGKQYLEDGLRVEVALLCRLLEGELSTAAEVDAQVLKDTGPGGPLDNELADRGLKGWSAHRRSSSEGRKRRRFPSGEPRMCK